MIKIIENSDVRKVVGGGIKCRTPGGGPMQYYPYANSCPTGMESTKPSKR